MRKFAVKVITRARKESVEKLSDGSYKVKVSVPPEKGRANQKIIEMLSREFGINRGNVRIVSGLSANKKIIEIDD